MVGGQYVLYGFGKVSTYVTPSNLAVEKAIKDQNLILAKPEVEMDCSTYQILW